jgi:hypothetical protein
MKMGQIGCPETSVKNYNYPLRNNTEERSSHIFRGGTLRSGKVIKLTFPIFNDVTLINNNKSGSIWAWIFKFCTKYFSNNSQSSKFVSIFWVLTICIGIYCTRPKIFMDIGKSKFPDKLLVTEPARLLNYRTSYVFKTHLHSIFLVTDSIPVYRVTRLVQTVNT